MPRTHRPCEAAIRYFSIVMLLHRYFGSHAFETLKEVELKTSRLGSFNDPFEFLFRTTGKMTARKAREFIQSRRHHPSFLNLAAQHIPGLFDDKKAGKVLEKRIPTMIAWLVANSEKINTMTLENRERTADKTLRVICLAEATIKPLDEILLWSHYARKHAGIRIGFEFPNTIKDQFQVFEVKYQENRIEVDLSNTLTDGSVGAMLFECAQVKSLAWSYEHEHRLITSPRNCKARTMPDSMVEHFLAFKREWVKTVDFGVRCTKAEIQRVVSLLKTDYPHVLCRKAEFHKSEFALQYEDI